ncbi:hypothetical protein OROMI_011686 [Orobanche minor]
MSAGFTLTKDDEIEEIDDFNSTQTSQKWKDVWNIDGDDLTGSIRGRKRPLLENETPESSHSYKKNSSNKKGFVCSANETTQYHDESCQREKH